MAQRIMYPAKANSPETTLVSEITATAAAFTVADGAKLPEAPNVLTIGVGETAETVQYAGLSGNSVSGCIRGYDGTAARIWPASTPCRRAFTAYDHDTASANITDLEANKLAKTGDAKDAVVTFTAAAARANIATGEKMSALFGKAAKYFGDMKEGAFALFGTGNADIARGNHAHAQYAQTIDIPDVPDWALQPDKPAYMAAEVDAVPTGRTVNGKALSTDVSLTAGDVNAVGIVSGKATPGAISAPVITITASRMLALADAGALLLVDASGDVTITIPTNDMVAFPIGTEIEIVRFSAGAVSIDVSAGVTARSVGGASSVAAQYGAVSLKQVAVNVWWVAGGVG